MLDAPLTPLVKGCRAEADRWYSGVPSGFPFGHCPFVCGLLRGAAAQPPKSPAADMEFPFG